MEKQQLIPIYSLEGIDDSVKYWVDFINAEVCTPLQITARFLGKPAWEGLDGEVEVKLYDLQEQRIAVLEHEGQRLTLGKSKVIKNLVFNSLKVAN
jgi:hypothetical protein